jgi:capsule polysaccharide export protein KpsE/RkpR
VNSSALWRNLVALPAHNRAVYGSNPYGATNNVGSCYRGGRIPREFSKEMFVARMMFSKWYKTMVEVENVENGEISVKEIVARDNKEAYEIAEKVIQESDLRNTHRLTGQVYRRDEVDIFEPIRRAAQRIAKAVSAGIRAASKVMEEI